MPKGSASSPFRTAWVPPPKPKVKGPSMFSRIATWCRENRDTRDVIAAITAIFTFAAVLVILFVALNRFDDREFAATLHASEAWARSHHTVLESCERSHDQTVYCRMANGRVVQYSFRGQTHPIAVSQTE